VAKVKKFLDMTTLKADVAINEIDLDNDIAQQAALYAHYGVLMASAMAQMDNWKNRVEIVEAFTGRQSRQLFIEEGKKPTEKMVDQEVTLNAKVQATRNASIEAKEQYEGLKIARDAMAQRKDMLIQIAVTRRGEREGELFIKRADVTGRNQHQDRVERASQIGKN